MNNFPCHQLQHFKKVALCKEKSEHGGYIITLNPPLCPCPFLNRPNWALSRLWSTKRLFVWSWPCISFTDAIRLNGALTCCEYKSSLKTVRIVSTIQFLCTLLDCKTICFVRPQLVQFFGQPERFVAATIIDVDCVSDLWYCKESADC